MSYHILYESSPWHSRAALFDESGRLLTLRFDDHQRRYIKDAVAWGRVRTVEKSLGGAFVDIGDRVDGFLPFSTLPPDQRKTANGKLTEGQSILVRVARGGFDGKGARLDARVALKPPGPEVKAPALVQPPPSCLKRALHDAGANPVTCWVPDARLRDVAHHHFADPSIKQVDRDEGRDAEGWFDRLEAELDTILSPRPTWSFRTGGGLGSLIVEITSAVATIDVNAGPSAKGGRNDNLLAANLAAASEVARLCRLLDLGGSVIVDFITPDQRQQRDIITDHLTAAFTTTDDKFMELRPMSRHGLVEITRERSGPSLTFLLRYPNYVAGRILLNLWRQMPGSNPRVRRRSIACHPDVASLLAQELTTELCLAHLGMPVVVTPDRTLEIASYKISD